MGQGKGRGYQNIGHQDMWDRGGIHQEFMVHMENKGHWGTWGLENTRYRRHRTTRKKGGSRSLGVNVVWG